MGLPTSEYSLHACMQIKMHAAILEARRRGMEVYAAKFGHSG